MNLAEVSPIVWLTLAWFAGLTVRVLWPYFLARANAEKSMAWDWNYIIGQVFGAVLGYLPTIAAAGFAEQLGVLGIVGAFAFGYGGASFGRNSQKTVSTIRSK